MPDAEQQEDTKADLSTAAVRFFAIIELLTGCLTKPASDFSSPAKTFAAIPAH